MSDTYRHRRVFELCPPFNKAHTWVFEALLDIRASLPFPLTGIDSDNGSECINSVLLKGRRDERIRFTRSRAYRKNDNRFVEQKTSRVAETSPAITASPRPPNGRPCRSLPPLCPPLNFFMPAIKPPSKTRVGTKKVYDKNVISPYRRLPASPDLRAEVKAGLSGRFAQHDPVTFQREVHKAVDALVSLNRATNHEGTDALAISALHAV